MYSMETPVPAKKYQSREPVAGKASYNECPCVWTPLSITLRVGKPRHRAIPCSGTFMGPAAAWGHTLPWCPEPQQQLLAADHFALAACCPHGCCAEHRGDRLI